ncbi:STAS domain-containing protein [Streptomyces tropicalis]|uniref:STAS domain-containing protein n=1 Tax=Streptomyces tropicalis TaxID=3034234 RepID=A0ABT6A1L7_9ACTN|nr:STAS domain-containing protein [Streptomyces tropicalis]MDF3298541.1 STAS domain-containing protein [Streptomyces tropicalis]
MTSFHGPAESGVSRAGPDGPVWVIALYGDFDMDVLDGVEDATATALRSFDGPVVFDLNQVAFCDSALLNLLLHTARRRPTALVGAGTFVLRLLDVTGAHRVLPVHPDLPAARTALTASGDGSRPA